MRSPLSFACATAVTALAVSGCGGGDKRQDADEPRGTWTVSTDARFPERQQLAEQVDLRIRVRNTESRRLPNVAVTVDGLSKRAEQPGLADPNRPVWIVDSGPSGGVTAYTNTWALGEIKPGGEKEFVWRLTPVEAGDHKVTYRVAAGLDGKARAELSGGSRPAGSFDVRVSREPAQSRVDPDTGKVVSR